MKAFLAIEDLVQFAEQADGPFGFAAKFRNSVLVLAQFEGDKPDWGAILTVRRIPLQ